MSSSVRGPPAARSSLRQPAVRASSVQASAVRSSNSVRHSTARHALASSVRPGAVSPAESAMSASVAAGTKRKERDTESDAGGGEETNINVVVRCRGRNARERREDSEVVVSTEGVKGNSIDLFMGANALSNKTYHFDRVFSGAADQSLLFDDTVKPMLEEVRMPIAPSRSSGGYLSAMNE
jgi:kinesin family member 11